MSLRLCAPGYASIALSPLLPSTVEVTWYRNSDDVLAACAAADIVWYDLHQGEKIVEAAEMMRWLFTLKAGVDDMPLALLQKREIRFSNGSGLNSANIADYAVMGILAAAKGLPDVIRAQDRREWLTAPPNTIELDGSKALVLGYGSIGRLIGERLAGLGVAVTGVRRRAVPAQNILGPDDWRGTLQRYDWVVLAAPATGATADVISFPELRAMKRDAWLINIGRGTLVNREALVDALTFKRIGGAFLDVTEPEPLPYNDPLWATPNTMITMHMAGQSQTGLMKRAAELFMRNLQHFLQGAPLENEVDLARGY